MKVTGLSDFAIELKAGLAGNPYCFEHMIPCEVKQYSVDDIVVFPDGALINKDYLVIEL